MSDFRALAGVSITLQTLLRDRMEMPAGVAFNTLPITISMPHAPHPPPNIPPSTEPAHINLFLYQVSENGALKNHDLRASSGAYGNPPLSLNLHYLMTAYGANEETGTAFVNESQGQQLLGSAMRVMHDYSIITDSLVTMREPVGQTILHASLRQQYEKLKICLDPLSLEDMTKIWTALTISYRLSAAYSISVVQIESRRQRRFPQLVGEPVTAGPMISVIPLQAPSINTLTVHRQGDPAGVERTEPYARIGDTLILRGQNLSGGTTFVSFNGVDIPVIPTSSQEIQLVIPDDSYAWKGAIHSIPVDERLQPGVQTIEVTTTPPGLPRAVARSNRVILMLTPHIKAVVAAGPRTVTINGTRLYDADMDGEVLIGRTLYPSEAYNAASSTSLQITLTDTMPYKSVNAYVTNPLGAFPALPANPEVNVTIDGTAHNVRLSSQLASFADVATVLQAGIRTGPQPAFKTARVSLVRDRFVLVAGGLQASFQIAGNSAAPLRLNGGTMRQGYVSAMLDPFPRLSTPPGKISIRINGINREVTLASVPSSIDEAAVLLGNAIRAADPAFNTIEVAALGDQLLILSSNGNAAISVDIVPNSDETTTSELGLRGLYAVRVRVNGAESIGGANGLELPL